MTKLKYILLLLAFAFIPQILSAEKVKIGELYYELNDQEGTAEITFQKKQTVENYEGFESIIIPNAIECNSRSYKVSSIGDNAFYGCYSLTKIEIPNSVISIGDNAFSYCSSLTSIEIPNSVKSIGEKAFEGCISLSSIEIPSSVTSIGAYTFSGCSSLTSITIPNSVTSIERNAFSRCSSLLNIAIPNSVTSLGVYALSGCSSLTSIVIPNSVTSIEERVFEGCSSLTSIGIPPSITSIGEYAFYDCENLKRVNISDLQAWCKIIFKDKYSNPLNNAHHLYLNDQEIVNLIIPNSVTSIGERVFSGCSSLTSIEIPNSVISIGAGAFFECRGLKSIEIPNSVTSIGAGAFFECRGLKSIEIPNSVTSIGNNAFWGCNSLTNIEIPNSVISIGAGTFFECRGLKSIEIPNSVTSIRQFAFFNCTSLTSIEIPNSVRSIGEQAFESCTGLTSVAIPNSVTSIGYKAFYGCSSLTSVVITNSVAKIGERAFQECSSLIQITVPQNLVVQLKQEYKGINIITDEKYYAAKDRDKAKTTPSREINQNQNLAKNENKSTSEISKDETKIDNSKSTNKSGLQEVKDKMLSWDEFYKKNRKTKLTFENISQIESHINKEIEKWQVKDEFESTNEWKARVNETTRKQKVRELSAPLIEQHNLEVAQINEEQKRLAQEYEKYKQDLIDGYYRTLIGQVTNAFSAGDFNLNPYDADNGTFLIRSAKYGDILLPVPGRDEARSFKDNWESIKKSIKPEFVPNGEDVALTKLIFTNNGNQYVYDSHTEANYAVTDVKYNFKPVELADISLDDINTNLPALANADVSSQIISKTSNEAITPHKVQPSKNTVVASDRSDVDYAIPTGIGDANSTTYAVIIANENYKTLSKVPYASKDGEIMSKYLTTAVGLPQSHVKVYKNATVGSMAEAVSYMEDLGKAYGDKLNLIFYYAGHGVPDEKTKTALLLPVDGNPSISKTCYSVDELVKNLGNLKANNVIVMLDACFSGATRSDDMLVAARGVKLRSNDIIPIGNMVFFSATQGDETAYPYEKEGHGLFTYFLLKKLQENKGNVTLGELADYVIEKVKQKSMETNGKLQTPSVTVSPNLQSSWREIPLK